MGLIGSMNIESQQSPDVYKSVIYTRNRTKQCLIMTEERRAIETQEQRAAKLYTVKLSMHVCRVRPALPTLSIQWRREQPEHGSQWPLHIALSD